MKRATENLARFWGYEAFRPMQQDAVASIMSGRDTVCVMPTGGGKSICYQVPATVLEGTAIVVSPLIALMKDQVDGLTACGVPAACVHSGMSENERRSVWEATKSGSLDLLYVTPERLMQERFIGAIQPLGVAYVAIDEAHCVSEWGHDFRPEYRSLGELKERLPGVPIHAFTATATARVQHDICEVLALDDPEVIVGSFDRENLAYHVRRRDSMNDQVIEVIERFPDDAGIIYCIRRKDVDSLTETLQEKGYSAAPYHAGLDDYVRARNQDAFIKEGTRIIVATIAFGMGIDKPDVRYVIHTGMPKSIENYQQESGRAGRDGLPSECHLLYSGQDLRTWRFMTRDLEGEAAQAAEQKLNDMMAYCTGASCRHQAISTYFEQRLPAKNCNACDICLGHFESVDDADDIAQRVLRGVLALNERFGAAHVAEFLSGGKSLKILERGHDKLDGYGLLKEFPLAPVRRWVEEMCDQGFLVKGGEYPTLQLTAEGRSLLNGDGEVRLSKPVMKKQKVSPAAQSLSKADKALFETLRALRRAIAAERGVPPYVVFGDKTLRALAEAKPTDAAALLNIYGIGQHKAEQFGPPFVQAIRDYLGLDGDAEDRVDVNDVASRKHDRRDDAYQRFRNGWTVEETARELEMQASKVFKMLLDYIEAECVDDVSPWVDSHTADLIKKAARKLGRPKPSQVHRALNGEVDYGAVRIVLAQMWHSQSPR